MRTAGCTPRDERKQFFALEGTSFGGVALTGLAGVLIAASKHGYFDSARSSLEELQANNFRLSRKLVDTIVELAGES